MATAAGDTSFTVADLRELRVSILLHAVGGVAVLLWAMGAALDRDSADRDLPVWRGCRVIGDGEIFLMNWQSADSFDGRYVGPLPVTTIIDRALPLWIDEEGDGRYEWRAPTR